MAKSYYIMKYPLVVLTALLVVLGCANQKPTTKKSTNTPTSSASKDDKIKPYSKVITSAAKTDDGLFKVHQIGEKYYYEIPNAVLQKDMLWVSRIAQIPSNLGGGYMNAGSKTNEQVIHWVRFQDKILLKVKRDFL